MSASRTSPLRVVRGDPLADAFELGTETLPLELRGRERALERLELPAPRGRLLPDTPPDLVDPSALLVGEPEPLLGLLELALAERELSLHGGDLLLDPDDLLDDGVGACSTSVACGDELASGGLGADGLAVREVGALALESRAAEDPFGVGERLRGSGTLVRRREHLVVERIEPFARLAPLLQALVPPALPALAFTEQRPQASRRQPARERLRLAGEVLVLLGHVGLLPEGPELAAELGEDVREPEQILVEVRELALRPLLAPAMLRDPGRLLDVLAPVLGSGEEHLLELTLPDDGVERAADPALAEQLLDVHEPDDLAADPVLASRRCGRSSGRSRSPTWAPGSRPRRCRSRASPRPCRGPDATACRRRSRRPSDPRGGPGVPARPAPS